MCTHTLKLPLDGLGAIMNGYLAHSIALLHSIWDGAVFFDTEVLRFHSTAHDTLEHVVAHLHCSSVLPRSTSDLVVFEMADETNGGKEVAAVEAAAATAMDFATTCGQHTTSSGTARRQFRRFGSASPGPHPDPRAPEPAGQSQVLIHHVSS